MQWEIDVQVVGLIAGIATVLLQIAKGFATVKERTAWHPVLAILFAAIVAVPVLALSALAELPRQQLIAQWIMYTLVSGLAASGLYSNVRKLGNLGIRNEDVHGAEP